MLEEILLARETATFEVEAPGLVRVEYGPISMRIRAEEGKEAYTQAALTGAHQAVATLDALARFQHIARQPIGEVQAQPFYPEALNRMIQAARSTGIADVTPMVAVAGSIAELVLEAVLEAGATTVYVDNGGDIALRVEEGRTLRVGVAQDLESKSVSHVIPVTADSGIGGICTSGLGGRSFTKGVASAAVAIGGRASIADACATLIGNATLVDDPAVEQELAERIDPLTDIVGHRVTTRVGTLGQEAVQRALAQGIDMGRRFVELNLLHGTMLVVQGQVEMWPPEVAQPRRKQPREL